MDDLPTKLELVVGEHREVVLPGLGTAGYRWDSDVVGDTGSLTLEWRRGQSPEEARGRPMGVSAPERLTITAAAPGQVTLLLRQRRPWESGPPRAEHTIDVEVVSP